MVERNLPGHLSDELARLALLREDDVDTSDIPEVADFSKFRRRGRVIDSSLIERGYDIRALANWFVARFLSANRPVTNLSLNKILYLAVERGMIEKNILLSPAKIEAWNYGPVFREIYHASKQAGREPITESFKTFDLSTREFVAPVAAFTDEDVSFFEGIFADYGALSPTKLVDLTHEEGSPWHAVWLSGRNVNFGMEITRSIILSRAKRSRFSSAHQEG